MHSWGVGGLNVFISIRPDVFEVVPRENLRIELQCTVSLSNSATSVPDATDSRLPHSSRATQYVAVYAGIKYIQKIKRLSILRGYFTQLRGVNFCVLFLRRGRSTMRTPGGSRRKGSVGL